MERSRAPRHYNEPLPLVSAVAAMHMSASRKWGLFQNSKLDRTLLYLSQFICR